MVICIAALIIFSVLGIFSVRWRHLAKEAFECVFRMLTLRPCITKLDVRIKSKVTAKLMGKTPTVAKFFYKNFKIISWIFTISFFISMFYAGYGVYNLVVYGSCTPGATCAVTPLAQFISCYETQIVYGIIAFAVIILLFLMRKNFKIKFR